MNAANSHNRLARRLAAALVPAVALLGPPIDAAATTKTGTFQVKTTVNPYVQITSSAPPTSYTFKNSDLNKKAYTYPSAIPLTIQSNDRNGVVLTVSLNSAASGTVYDTVSISGLPSAVLLSPAGTKSVQVTIPRSGNLNAQTLNLQYTFTYVSSSPAGTYNWPVSMSVAPN